MTRIALSNMNWADMKDPEEITSRERKTIFRDLGQDMSDTPDVPPIHMADVVVTHLLKGWSFELTLPTRAQVVPPKTAALSWSPESSLDDLSVHDYDELSKQANIVIKAITPNFEPNPDPKSPTVPSGD